MKPPFKSTGVDIGCGVTLSRFVFDIELSLIAFQRNVFLSLNNSKVTDRFIEFILLGGGQ